MKSTKNDELLKKLTPRLNHEGKLLIDSRAVRSIEPFD